MSSCGDLASCLSNLAADGTCAGKALLSDGKALAILQDPSFAAGDPGPNAAFQALMHKHGLFGHGVRFLPTLYFTSGLIASAATQPNICCL